MLKKSFIHIQGIGKKTEERIWKAGISTWDDFTPPKTQALSKIIQKRVRDGIDRHPKTILDTPDYLYKALPSNQHWRLFPRFRKRIAYVDIETTGTHKQCIITTIALYDGDQILTFVNGENLHTFPEILKGYQVIVTYNGKSFDVPIMNRFFNIDIDMAHIDLRPTLAQIGLKGGLKGCERQLGIDRRELSGVDGYGAVILWREYQKFKNRDVLSTLLAYNVADVISMEPLLIHAYNRNLAATPFHVDTIDTPPMAQLPYTPNTTVVARVKRLLAERQQRY